MADNPYSIVQDDDDGLHIQNSQTGDIKVMGSDHPAYGLMSKVLPRSGQNDIVTGPMSVTKDGIYPQDITTDPVNIDLYKPQNITVPGLTTQVLRPPSPLVEPSARPGEDRMPPPPALVEPSGRPKPGDTQFANFQDQRPQPMMAKNVSTPSQGEDLSKLRALKAHMDYVDSIEDRIQSKIRGTPDNIIGSMPKGAGNIIPASKLGYNVNGFFSYGDGNPQSLNTEEMEYLIHKYEQR